MKTLALLIISLTVFAQTKSTQSPSKPVPIRPATVSGRVFLITRGGDLKPGRLASVYMVFVYSKQKKGEDRRLYDARRSQDSGDTAGHEWEERSSAALDDQLKFAETLSDEVAKEYRASSESYDRKLCTYGLRAHLHALEQTIAWAKDNNRSRQILTTQADEDGNFHFSVPIQGLWTVFAYGHAGINEAFWQDADVAVENGSAYTVKLSSPETACVAAE